jgi:hypothetical protein
MFYSHYVGFVINSLFAVRRLIRRCSHSHLFSHWFVIPIRYSHSLFAFRRLIRYSHAFFAFRRFDSWFAFRYSHSAIRIESLFALSSYSHSLFVFDSLVVVDSLFAFVIRIRYSQWFAFILCSHYVGCAIRYSLVSSFFAVSRIKYLRTLYTSR